MQCSLTMEALKTMPIPTANQPISIAIDIGDTSRHLKPNNNVKLVGDVY